MCNMLAAIKTARCEMKMANGKWKMENSTFSYCCLSMCVCVCWLLATEKSQTNKKLVVEKLLQLQVEKRKSSNRKKNFALMS